MERSRARRGVFAYLAALVVATGAVQMALFRSGGRLEEHPWGVLALMWTPALASLVARLVDGSGIGDVSFRWGKSAKFVAMACAFPWGVGALSYGAAWSTHLAEWSPSHRFSLATGLALRFIVNPIVGTLIGSVFAAGEEIGWRGYLVTRLSDAGVPRFVFVSGLIWASWHVPLILSGQYVTGPIPWLAAILFFATILPFAYWAAWLRFRSGSIWPPVAAHAAWNAIIQGVFDRSTREPTVWVGESGVLTAVASVVLVLLLVRGSWELRRSPGDNALKVAQRARHP